jgi:hypothetical protein
MNEIVVRELADSSIRDWLDVPHFVYRDDRHFVPRLDLLERARVSKRKNHFFGHGEAAFFVAYKDGRPVGRISAQADQNYLARYQDATGHFGFYDVPDDAEVSRRLLAAAAGWLSSRGLRRVTGPFSLTINEESGLLVSGYDMPASVAMPHAAPWQPALLERAGFRGIRDLLGFRFKPGSLSDTAFWQLMKIARKTSFNARITIRDMNKRNFDEEIRTIVDIFNEGSRNSWGAVPLTAEELSGAIGDYRLFFRKNYAKFICIDGKPEGFIFWTPNLVEITAKFGGKLFPLNWARLLYAFAFEKFRSGRMPLLGIRTAAHSRWRSFVLFALLFEHWLKDLARYDLDWMELAWIVESNRILVDMLRESLGPPVRVYRVYEASVEHLLAPEGSA